MRENVRRMPPDWLIVIVSMMQSKTKTDPARQIQVTFFNQLLCFMTSLFMTPLNL